MKPSIISVFTGVLTLLVAANPVLAISPKINSSVTLAQSRAANDNLIVPGVRVGAITRTTSKQDLVKLYGASRLVDKTTPGAEGIGTNFTTEVKLGKEHRLLIIWTDSTRTKPAEVEILGTTWKTPEGLGLGTSWNILRQKLGNFKLYGLAWDYSGTILLESSRLSRYRDKLILRVNPADNTYKKYPRQYRAVSGDSVFSSSNPNWQPLNPKVAKIIVILNPTQN